MAVSVWIKEQAEGAPIEPPRLPPMDPIEVDGIPPPSKPIFAEDAIVAAPQPNGDGTHPAKPSPVLQLLLLLSYHRSQLGKRTISISKSSSANSFAIATSLQPTSSPISSSLRITLLTSTIRIDNLG